MRTAIYIDGFNFYYGAVKGTSYKWLNPKQLYETILKPQTWVLLYDKPLFLKRLNLIFRNCLSFTDIFWKLNSFGSSGKKQAAGPI